MSQSPIKGFTLVEILAVITIVSVLSVVITPRLSLHHSSLNESKSNLIHALTTARQLAMFSSESNAQVQFLLNNHTMSIKRDNKDVMSLVINYPDHLSESIQYKPSTLLLNFNTLGETQEASIVLGVDGVSELIVIYSSGYIQ